MGDHEPFSRRIRILFRTIKLRLSGRRVYHANLYEQLANSATFFELSKATDDQLIRMAGNTARLMDGLLQEMNTREMPTDMIIDTIYEKLRTGEGANLS